MELSWSTFLLELFNFLILVWILKHFLYRPVREVIARRQQAINERLADAKTAQKKAEEIQQQYTSRLEEWRREQQKARDIMEQELQAERQHKMKALHEHLEAERQRVESLQRQQQQEEQKKLQRRALEQGSSFAARILTLAAGDEVEQRLGEILQRALADIPKDQAEKIRTQLAGADTEPEIASAYPLDEQQRAAISDALSGVLQRPVTGHFVEDPELLAGYRITLGAWELAANLRDELRGFAHVAGEPAGADGER
ncbi:F0F1 ATP synthase subunit delta [Microbulbifer guangxiensis]|uniref:F0F1 ATP synthase subunit delta n=1 Tax=Microbulbifer guangxiensis TaxID=2904249 RepID=UPI001F01E7CE|nr:F0F1 ATP synthase subunit delta [Microbulbifer guangxiensis]